MKEVLRVARGSKPWHHCDGTSLQEVVDFPSERKFTYCSVILGKIFVYLLRALVDKGNGMSLHTQSSVASQVFWSWVTGLGSWATCDQEQSCPCQCGGKDEPRRREEAVLEWSC